MRRGEILEDAEFLTKSRLKLDVQAPGHDLVLRRGLVLVVLGLVRSADLARLSLGVVAGGSVLLVVSFDLLLELSSESLDLGHGISLFQKF